MPIRTQQEHRSLAGAELDPATQEQEAGELAGGGPVPAVHADGATAAGGRASASELAYETAAGGDKNEEELKKKVGALVTKSFGGDYKKAFDHYDHDRDGGVGADELHALLKDAGIGNFATRGAWVNGILDKLDKTADRKIQWAEFQVVFSARG